jgi:hypothetical protein
MNQALTDKVVRTLPAPATGNKAYFDATVSGFGVRVTAAGARSFFINYRINGVERRFTIGRFPDWTTTAARTEAKRLKGQVRVNGVDPLAELQDKRSAPTVGDLIDRYVTEHLPRKRPSSQREDRYNLKHLAPLAKVKVAAITFADIDALHRKITKAGSPVAANRVLALASKMFSLAIKWQWRSDNPCKGVERNAEHKRERYFIGRRAFAAPRGAGGLHKAI